MRSKVQYRSFSHWFSYHWGWFLAGAVVLLLAAQAAWTSPDGPAPDYVINWVGASSLSEEEAAAVSDAAAAAGTDQNGDGLVTVAVDQFVVNYSLSPDDYRYQDSYANHMKLLAQIQTGECYLFLVDDPEGFQGGTGALQYLDGSIPADTDRYECENWEDMCVPWRIAGVDRTCWLGRRALFGRDDSQALFPGSDALFQALAAGTQKGGTSLD